MSFLTPWVAAIVAAIVVPALIILYFLKLRRREQLVASTFLWQRAVREMQVNAPFQRLRKNLLLLLQLLVLAAGIFALARPIVRTSLSEEASVVILIDRSASMNTREDDERTRLDVAKEQATRLARTFNQVGSRWMSFFSGVDSLTRVMVVAFSDRATVVSPFTTNMSDVVDRIEDIEPTDGRTNIKEALELAEAYMKQTRIEQAVESTEAASSLVLYSDGCVPALADLALRAGRVKFIPIGAKSDNVAVTAFRAERNYEEPELLGAFLQVQNFGETALRTDVSILVDGRLQAVRELSLGPARRGDAEGAAEGDDGPGASAALSFEFPLPESAVLTARVARRDDLATDNEASVIVAAPRKLRVLLVSAKNFFLERVLRFLPLEEFKYLTPEQYESAPEAELEENGRSIFDVVVFDKHDTARLPMGNYLFVACVPQIEDVKTGDEIGYHAMMWWDETHPVLRHVALEHVLAAKATQLTLPPDAQKLAEGPSGPELARLIRDGRQYLILAFALEDSTWWGKPSFPVFMYNAVRFLGSGGAGAEDEPLRPGDTLLLPAPPDAETVKLRVPDGKSVNVTPTADGVVRFAGTARAGVYRLEPGVPGRDAAAVNLEDAFESDVRPSIDLSLGAGVQVEVGQKIDTATPEIWRWFVGAALLIALIEWIVYNRRVMI